jgi:hypothetical protein
MEWRSGGSTFALVLPQVLIANIKSNPKTVLEFNIYQPPLAFRFCPIDLEPEANRLF